MKFIGPDYLQSGGVVLGAWCSYASEGSNKAQVRVTKLSGRRGNLAL